jgi:hypothetical protein
MRKLTLDLDAIRVESFSTQPQPATRGTVDAKQQGRETFGCTLACTQPGENTCDPSCAGSCTCPGPSQWNTCFTCDITCAGTTCNGALTCGTCQATCNYATGPERCCGY